jgi:UrcA family protein
MFFRTLPLAICALAFAASAQASVNERVVARVSIAGLDLQQASHRAVLEQRVMIAARRACRFDNRSLVPMTDGRRACIAEMMADGRAQALRIAARAAQGRAIAVR